MSSVRFRLTKMTLAALSVCLTHSIARDLPAQTVLPKILRNVGFDQRLNEQVPLDIPFVDDEGQRVTLGKYFGDNKPVILVLAYYRCPMLCTQVLNGLVQGMRDMPFTIGKEFRVVTVSFDSHETTEMAAAKRRTYLHSYGKPEAAEGWHFLTGSEQSISRLTRAVGFRFAYDPLSDQLPTRPASCSSRRLERSPVISTTSITPGVICDWGWSKRAGTKLARRSIRFSCFASPPIRRLANTARRS